MNIALWIVQVLLLAMFVMVGSTKAFSPSRAKETMPWAKDRSSPFLRMVGTFEILGGIGLVLPMLTGILPLLTPLAALGLSLIQLLAIITVHIPRKEFNSLPMNIVLMGLAIFVAVGRWGLLMA